MRHHHPARHARPIRLRTAATASAAAVLAIAAAAVTMAAMTRPAIPAPRPTFHTDAAMTRRAVHDQRVAARDAATRRAAAAYAARHTTIGRGDSLSKIAAAHGMTWMALYEANRGRVGRNPNVVTPGLLLRIPMHPGRWERRYAAHPYVAPRPIEIPVATPAPPSGSSGGSVDPVAAQGPPSTIAPSAGGSFEDCVIARESGGNSQVMNSSGHYGLFQFSYSTWVANGGAPGDFGNASAAAQQAVFNQTMATGGGASNWAPYDGC